MNGRPLLHRVLPIAFTLCAVLSAAPSARAQNGKLAEIAAYQGPDRQQKLVAGARKETELTLYSSIPVEDIAALTGAFEKKYGVKVKVWRADSEGFLQRIVQEAKARRYDVDVMAGSSSATEPLYRENLLQEVKSPYLADLLPGTVAPHGQWATAYLNTFVQAYNTDIVPREALPKSFRDLLKPEWKGKIGVEAEDFDWFAQVVTELGEAQGLKLFRDIVATNGISVRKGHTQLNNAIVSGELALGLSAYGFISQQTKAKGAPLDWFIIPPLIARPTAAGVARYAPHPHAAVLFYDFLLGGAQPILAARNFVPATSKIESPFTRGQQVKLIDSGMMLDNSQKWQDLYQTTIVSKSR